MTAAAQPQPGEETQGAISLGDREAVFQRADTRTRASGPPVAPPVAPVPPPSPAGDDTRENRAAAARATLHETAARLRRTAAEGQARAPLAHRPSMGETRAHHHAAASRWEAALIRGPRLTWGYAHLALKYALHLIEWATESPVTAAVVAALVLACLHWL